MKGKRSSNILSYIAMPAISGLLTLLLFELVARIFLQASPFSYGVLWGRVLPPKAVVTIPTVPEIEPDAWYSSLVVNERKITKSDLWGIMREDADVGWIPRENAVSTNGWWQTNNLGARSVKYIDYHKPADKTRVLIFGDSFAQGSRLPQEQTWAHLLSERHPNLENLNFGVDGYSMGQALLWYRKVQDRLDYDVVLFLFVPEHDLWRDISTIRSLARPSWQSFTITPRFILEDERLRAVKSPYVNARQFYENNYLSLSEEAREHLRKYDRFYISPLYEDPPILKYLVSYKLAALWYGKKQIAMRIRSAFKDLDSEAWRVTREIYAAAKASAEERGAKFILGVLPSHRNIRLARQDGSFQAHWKEMVQILEGSDLHVIDLLPMMSEAPIEQLDRGYDGTHYGPKASQLIADAVGLAIQAAVPETKSEIAIHARIGE